MSRRLRGRNARRLEYRGLGNVALDVEDQKRGQDADPEHGSPGQLRRKRIGGEGVADGRDAPADRPSALHRTQRLSPVPRRDGFAHQHRANRPLPAKAETLQSSNHQQLAEGVGKTAQECEERKPQNRDLQQCDPAIAISRQSGEPSSQRRKQERGCSQQTGLSLGDIPQSDQTGNRKAVDHDVHAVEHPASKGGNQGGALAGRELGNPGAAGVLRP